MATVGNIPPSPVDNGYSGSIGRSGICIEITMPEAGTAVSIWYWGDSSAASDIYAAIYDSSNNLVTNEVAPITPGAATDQWFEIPLTGAALSNAAVYSLALASDTDSSGLVFHGQAGDDNFTGSGDDYQFFNGTWAASGQDFPNGTPRDRAMYLEYTPSGGGDPEGRLIGGKLIRGGLLRSGVL